MKTKFVITMILLIVSNVGFSMMHLRKNPTRSLSLRRLFCPAPVVNEGYQEFGENNSIPDEDLYTTVPELHTSRVTAEPDNESQGSTEPYQSSTESEAGGYGYHAFTEYQETPQLNFSDDISVHQESEAPRYENPFYLELMDLPATTKEYYDKLGNLVKLIDSVGAMKLFYTHVMVESRLGNLPYFEDAKSFIKEGLQQTSTTVGSDQSYEVFKLILDKAFKDKVINIHEYEDLEEQALCVNSSPQTQESGLPNVLENNTALESIPDEIVVSVKNYLQQIQSIAAMKKNTFIGFQDKFYEKSIKEMELRIEAGVGVMGLILNALLFANYRVGDGSQIDNLVDFSDSRLASSGNANELLDSSNSNIKDILTNAVSERDSLEMILSIAAIIKFNEVKKCSPECYEI